MSRNFLNEEVLQHKVYKLQPISPLESITPTPHELVFSLEVDVLDCFLYNHESFDTESNMLPTRQSLLQHISQYHIISK